MGNNNKVQYKDSNWYVTITNGIAGALSKFVGVFKKHGLLFTTFVMVLFIIFYSLIINPLRIDRIVENRFETEKERIIEENELSMQKRLIADEMIGNIMTRLIDKFENVNRVLLLEAHNSVQNRSGVHFSYFSATAEMLTPNSRTYNYLSEDLQKQQRNTLIGVEMVNTLKRRDYIYFNNIKECRHPQHRILHKVAEAGEDNELIIYPFLNTMREPIILLIISGNDLKVNEIVEYIHEYRTQIEHCLM